MSIIEQVKKEKFETKTFKNVTFFENFLLESKTSANPNEYFSLLKLFFNSSFFLESHVVILSEHYPDFFNTKFENEYFLNKFKTLYDSGKLILRISSLEVLNVYEKSVHGKHESSVSFEIKRRKKCLSHKESLAEIRLKGFRVKLLQNDIKKLEDDLENKKILEEAAAKKKVEDAKDAFNKAEEEFKAFEESIKNNKAKLELMIGDENVDLEMYGNLLEGTEAAIHSSGDKKKAIEAAAEKLKKTIKDSI